MPCVEHRLRHPKQKFERAQTAFMNTVLCPVPSGILEDGNDTRTTHKTGVNGLRSLGIAGRKQSRQLEPFLARPVFSKHQRGVRMER